MVAKFLRSEENDPHSNRRKIILEKYPQIIELYGHDPTSAPFVILTLLSHLFICYISKYLSWTTFILITWVIGGALSVCLIFYFYYYIRITLIWF